MNFDAYRNSQGQKQRSLLLIWPLLFLIACVVRKRWFSFLLIHHPYLFDINLFPYIYLTFCWQVDARLDDIRDTAIGNKIFLDGHVSAIDGIATDLKRKWQDSYVKAETNFKDNNDFSAAKHCRMELLLQKWWEFSNPTVILVFFLNF